MQENFNQNNNMDDYELRCPGNYPVQNFCVNEKCPAQLHLICVNNEVLTNCICQQIHESCHKKSRQSIQDYFEEKQKYRRQINNQLKGQIKKSKTKLKQIQKMVLKRTKLITQNQLQMKFKRIFNQGSNENITKQQIQILREQQSNKFQAIKHQLNQFADSVRMNMNKQLLNLNTFQTQLSLNMFMFSSSIVNQQQQTKKIQRYFLEQNQYVKRLTLLYRASQNQYSAQQFRHICNGKTNTLTICQNQYGIKIGGYTPCSWKQEGDGGFPEEDSSRKTFICNLTNDHKFTCRPNIPQIYQQTNQGPHFGASDFRLADNCNLMKSQCHLNTFYNQNYTFQNSNQLMTGSPDGEFLVRQYEVWQVELGQIMNSQAKKLKNNQGEAKNELILLTPDKKETPNLFNLSIIENLITNNPDFEDSADNKLPTYFKKLESSK